MCINCTYSPKLPADYFFYSFIILCVLCAWWLSGTRSRSPASFPPALSPPQPRSATSNIVLYSVHCVQCCQAAEINSLMEMSDHESGYLKLRKVKLGKHCVTFPAHFKKNIQNLWISCTLNFLHLRYDHSKASQDRDPATQTELFPVFSEPYCIHLFRIRIQTKIYFDKLVKNL